MTQVPLATLPTLIVNVRFWFVLHGHVERYDFFDSCTAKEALAEFRNRRLYRADFT